jgi:hypothetical protein
MPEYFISSGLPSYPSGLSDKEAALVLPLYRAIGTLAQQISTLTGNVQYSGTEQGQIDQLTKLLAQRTQKIFVQAGETLGYGNLVTLSLASGKIVANKADATNLNKPAHAVIDTPGGIATNQFGEAIFLQGRTSGITGTTFGAPYWLSTAGQVQAVKPEGPGVLTQYVGLGLGTAGFYADLEEPKRTAYGSFLDTTDHIAAATNTAYAITFNSTVFSQDISIGSPTSRVVISKPGLYNFQFSLQLINTAGGAHRVAIWPRVNGLDVTASATLMRLQGNNTEAVAAWNFVLPMNANDYFELMYAVTDVSLKIVAYAATAPHPVVPSILLTVTNNI